MYCKIIFANNINKYCIDVEHLNRMAKQSVDYGVRIEPFASAQHCVQINALSL